MPLGRAAAEWSLSRRVQVGRWSVRYRATGAGPPVVLVHGLGVSADYWWRVGPPLAAAGFHVLAPDLPGFGRTSGPRGGLSIFEQAEAVLRWAEAMALESAAFVGHSLSCQALLELAAAHPDRVRALVLAAPTGAAGRLPRLRQALALLRDVPRESVPLAVFVAQAYLRAGPRRLWRTWRMGTEEDPLRTAARVRAPALVLVGRRDPVVPADFAAALAAALPLGRLEWVEDAAHAIIFDGAEEAVRAITRMAR